MSGSAWLSDAAWAVTEPHLPEDCPGAPRVDDRRVITGILHVLRSGCRWSDCPAEYGPPTTLYNRYNRWRTQGVWRRLFTRLAAAGYIPDKISIQDDASLTVPLLELGLIPVASQGRMGSGGNRSSGVP
jgi:transposase